MPGQRLSWPGLTCRALSEPPPVNVKALFTPRMSLPWLESLLELTLITRLRCPWKSMKQSELTLPGLFCRAMNRDKGSKQPCVCKAHLL